MEIFYTRSSSNFHLLLCFRVLQYAKKLAELFFFRPESDLVRTLHFSVPEFSMSKGKTKITEKSAKNDLYVFLFCIPIHNVLLNIILISLCVRVHFFSDYIIEIKQ